MARSLIITDSPIWIAETEYALAVAAAESSMGFDVCVMAPANSAAADAARGRFALLELPGPSPSRSPADFMACVRRLFRLIRDEQFDVVHTSRATPHVMAALSSGRRAPLVHLRGSAKVPARHPLNRYLYRRRTDAVIASSSRVRRLVIERLGVPEAAVHRILSPIDVGRFDPRESGADLKTELGIESARPVVVNVARLAPIKGHDVLIDAMSRVARTVSDAALVLVGEPWVGQLERLEALAHDRDIGSAVHFVGRRSDVPRFLAMADVCVSSSVGSEDNSRAVGEYMAAGRAVVATRVGVLPELVMDGVTGRLVAPHDRDAMAGALIDLLVSNEKRRQMGAAGRIAADRELSYGSFGERLSRVLDSAAVAAR